MTDEKVFPGEEVAIEEEYLASNGTFARNGKVYAAQIGKLVLDDEECVAKVISPNPPNVLAPGDIVYARIGDIRNTMATADVLTKEGTARQIGSETYGTLHVSKIADKYTDDISKELRKGDLVRAVVTGVKPSLQLSTKGEHFGVIKSLCGRCKSELVRKGNVLYCEKCEKTFPRKLADDYGNVEM